MFDREVVSSKLRFLREYLEDLKEYENVSLVVYQTKKKDQRFVERTLHLACECCLDVAAHLISRQGFREPGDNKDLFHVLFENLVIGEETCRSMVKMAKFRNIIVHDYARIDPVIVIGILKNDLRDLKRFAGEVLRYMDAQHS